MNLNLAITDDGTVPSGFLATLNDRLRQITSAFKAVSTAPATGSASLQGMHGARLAQDATKLAQGTQFFETDRHSIYIVRALGKAGTWAYEAGIYSAVYANRPSDLGKYDDGFVFFATDKLQIYIFDGNAGNWFSFSQTTRSDTFANRPQGLTGNDAGLLYHCTTGTGGVAYNHTFEWDGTKWTVAERETLGGYFQDYLKPPTEPGWQLADGSATHYLDIVAGALTEVAITLPDLTVGAYRKGTIATGYLGTVVPPGLIVLAGSTSVIEADGGATVQSGSGAHAPGGTPTHSHALDPVSSTATATLAGDPVPNISVIPYFRR